MKDSSGIEIKAGDIIEAVDCPEGSGEKYHVCFSRGYDEIEVRDLGNNNVGMWQLYSTIKNLGHFTINSKLLDNTDFDYYFGLNINTLKHNGVTSLIVNGVELIGDK